MPATILSIDVEEWYHLNYSSMDAIQNRRWESRVRANTEFLLTLMDECNAKATFFFLGSVAESHPDLVLEVQRRGHEIASHGYAHQLIYRQTREEFYQDVKRSVDILRETTGQVVKGFRAPSWSISREKTPWVYEVLSEVGLSYSASLFPYTTYLYGDGTAPVKPFTLEVMGRRFFEVPATVLDIGWTRFPYSGGFYFRLLPSWVIQWAIRRTHRHAQPVILYLHPREIDPDQPRLPLAKKDYFVTYVNLKSTAQKLKNILQKYPTITISRYLELE